MVLQPSQLERTVFDMEQQWPSSEELAETVKAALKAAGLSQRDAAEQSGVALTTLNRRLGGDPFTYKELVALAKVLRVRVSALMSAAESRQALEPAA